MTVVIDDHLLLSLLAGTGPPSVTNEARSGTVYTTACWYYRLARAVASSGAGSLSGRFGELARAEQTQVGHQLDDLPAGIGILGWRTVVPVMAALRVRQQVNLLNAEVLAVALLTSATVVITTASPVLRARAGDIGVDYRIEH